ncbi:ISAs1 family transposase [Sulfurimonas sp.]|uniref:ISAs1 family transposase n=1 Tax=Sulfurimonas sp. TaxID=2022749 RepID=UPI0019E69B16|nr:ISAs1 family transposase [Sulfurimonas sp.]MBE0515761.1 ISAs1 family transposase [Sulfurimonas sp.]
MKEFNLREELKTLKDNRRGQAQQHKIDVVLMITIMATMSGHQGYRAIGDFAQRYKKELVKYLSIEKERVPAYATVRRVLMNINHKKFEDIFTKWMRHYMRKTHSGWIAVDGKAIKGTKQKEEDKKLAHLVSFFASDSLEILTARKTASKSNEIPLVQEMMETFPLKDMIITLDAMHCQTKTLKAIKDSGNDYVVQVKDNQKNS